MAEGQPTFRGTADEQKVAEMMHGLMAMQGRAYAADAPIRQSLGNFTDFFLQNGIRATQEEVKALIEAAVMANNHAFFRQETDSDIYYVTNRKGQAVRPAQGAPARYIPPAAVTAPPAAPAPKREGGPVVITRATLLTSGTTPITPFRTEDEEPAPRVVKPTVMKHAALELEEEEEKPTVLEARREVKPAPIVKRPQIVTPEGEVIYMDLTPEEILETHGAYFQNLLGESLANDARFTPFGQEWLLDSLLVNFTKTDLRRVHDAIEETGDVLPDTTFLADLFGKSPDDEDYERTRFSLNYALAREKRVFEFRGTDQERHWGLLGMASLRPSRTNLRPSEIGQDFKFLEDEPPRTDEGAGRWIHTLTFYEIENGLLPYSATAKLILPRSLLKDQRVARLEFHAPQLSLSVTAELHYPSGNRGGWVEGLEEILDNFTPGARVVVEGTERDSLFLLTFRKSDPLEVETIRYDEKKRRFSFVPVVVEYQCDESMLVTKNRFKNLANALRLEENARRKGDQVIAFAFIKVGTKVMAEEKPVYRAGITDLLPVINLEKPFSRASLLRFMATHPHYQKDESEEGYYLYTPED